MILAAGGGSRFGGPKALVEFHGETLLARAIATVTTGGCSPIFVVVGARAESVKAAHRGAPVIFVDNEAWKTGMGSSLRAGLAAATGAPGVLVHLVDQPFVTPAAVAALIEAWRNGALAAVATYDGAPRTPVLLDASLFADVAELAVGDVGARAYLRAHPDVVTAVDCSCASSEDDIDTLEDLARLERRPATAADPDAT